MRLLLPCLLLLIATAIVVWRHGSSSHPQNEQNLPRLAKLAEDPMPGSHARLYTPIPSSTVAPNTSSPAADTPQVLEDRVAVARSRHGQSITRRCQDAGLVYPPRHLFLRAFKHEGEIEAWGSGDSSAMKLIATYSLTAKSGTAGPKRREGDRQIPEGCYRVVAFNPQSRFHLSLGLDYPNASDRVLSDFEKPGYDIYIHGNNVSIGCLAIGDDMIEELYLLAADVHTERNAEIPVHIFPTRMQGTAWDEFRTQHPEHADFWSELEPIYLAFESSHRVPTVKVNKTGTYELSKSP